MVSTSGNCKKQSGYHEYALEFSGWLDALHVRVLQHWFTLNSNVKGELKLSTDSNVKGELEFSTDSNVNGELRPIYARQKNMQIFSPFHLAVITIYQKRFIYFLLQIWASHGAAMFTNEVQKKVALQHICCIFQHYSWSHWHSMLDTQDGSTHSYVSVTFKCHFFNKQYQTSFGKTAVGLPFYSVPIERVFDASSTSVPL